MRGRKWKRSEDVAGTSLTASGVSGVHANYLAHGGLDFLIGDGRLNYSPELVWETYYSARLLPGFFFGLPEAKGPFPPNGMGKATVNLGAVANTNLFDGAVSASSGDVWAQSIDPMATYTPLHLEPGQAGNITLTITPNAPPGTVVHGFVAVDTFNLFSASGDELVNIPYTYKVG